MNKFNQEMRKRFLPISRTNLYKRYPVEIGRARKKNKNNTQFLFE